MHFPTLALISKEFTKSGAADTGLPSKFTRPFLILLILSCIWQLSDSFRMNSFTRMTSVKLGSRTSSAIISELEPLLTNVAVHETDLFKVAAFIQDTEVLYEDRIRDLNAKLSQLEMNHTYEKKLLESQYLEEKRILERDSKTEKESLKLDFRFEKKLMEMNLTHLHKMAITQLQNEFESHEHYHMKAVSILTQINVYDRLFRYFVQDYHYNDNFKTIVKDYLQQTKSPIKTFSYSNVNEILLQTEIRKSLWGKIGIPLDVEIPEYLENFLFLHGPISAPVKAFQ
jgi:hypothetical protein